MIAYRRLHYLMTNYCNQDSSIEFLLEEPIHGSWHGKCSAVQDFALQKMPMIHAATWGWVTTKSGAFPKLGVPWSTPKSMPCFSTGFKSPIIGWVILEVLQRWSQPQKHPFVLWMFFGYSHIVQNKTHIDRSKSMFLFS